MSLVSWKALAFAGLGYALLAIALTFPLVLHLSSVMPHDLGDPLLSTSLLWWNAQAVPFTERWWNGFAFYPAAGLPAFSDPRVGESLLATPLQWLGASPATAYNLTFLATYPASATAAHWLGLVLTRRHDAAAVAGLTFGFCPFRAAHVPHLELLAAFGMPVALGALHMFHATRRRSWLALFAAALVVQGLCSSYYLLFFAVFLGLWVLWFIRRGDGAVLAGIVAAGAAALAALVPLIVGYTRVHDFYGLKRGLGETLTFSADATSLLTGHETLALWGWTARWAKPEGELFPGLTIVVIVAAGAVAAWRRSGRAIPGWRYAWLLLPLAGVVGAIAIAGWAFDPWRISVPGLTIASDSPFKPMTIALLLIATWFAAAPQVRGAYQRRSALAFYLVAAFVLFLCSLGPKPALAGVQFLYEPPYAWLMRLPVFSSIRVPARFAMPAMLALAVAGALVLARWQPRLGAAARGAITAVLLLGIAADGWTVPLMLPKLPDMWTPSRADGFTAVIELPFGDLGRDLAAMYRATIHGKPVINGSSGFEPAPYTALKMAVNERDATALDWVPSGVRVLAIVDTSDPMAGQWDQYLMARPRVTRLAPEGHWAFYAMEPPPPRPPLCDAPSVPPAAAKDERGAVEADLFGDGNELTAWGTPKPQAVGDALFLDLGREIVPCALSLGLGEFVITYPRALTIESSTDAATWTPVATHRTAGLAVQAALESPTRPTLRLPLDAPRARYLRLRLEDGHPDVPWVVSEISVQGR